MASRANAAARFSIGVSAATCATPSVAFPPVVAGAGVAPAGAAVGAGGVTARGAVDVEPLPESAGATLAAAGALDGVRVIGPAAAVSAFIMTTVVAMTGSNPQALP